MMMMMMKEPYLSPIGWILEMVTSSLGSSFSRAQEEVKEALPPSLSHLDPKLSPTVKGLSLYLKQTFCCHFFPLRAQTADVMGRAGVFSLWGSGGEARLVKHVQF